MKRFSIATLAVLFATPALAHVEPGAPGSLAAGLAHPISGTDHVLAMLAVGLWAAALGGRALWLVPAAFVGTMLAGFGLALAGLALPAVEPMILASSVVLGLAMAMALRPSPAAAATLVGAFALFHGHGHGSELGTAGALLFAAGFVAATALLHAAGAALGLMLGGRGALTRLLGGGAALAGAALAGAALVAG